MNQDITSERLRSCPKPFDDLQSAPWKAFSSMAWLGWLFYSRSASASI